MDSNQYELKGSDGKPILLDIHFPAQSSGNYPVIIFAHGFKGFKDWGTFNRIAAWFAGKGFCFVKFNFSHNGTTPETPLEFTDLSSFAANTFSKEMNDLGKVIDFVLGRSFPGKGRPDKKRLCLMGHSRGGGIAILKAAEDKRVKKLVTWAAVNNFGKSWNAQLAEKWKKEGKIEVTNSRTGQRMPLNYDLFRDYQSHLDRLYIPAAVTKMNIPFLIIHGRNDETICVRAAYEMNDWNKDCTELYIVEDANHVFGASHPWTADGFPPPTEDALHKTLNFLLN